LNPFALLILNKLVLIHLYRNEFYEAVLWATRFHAIWRRFPLVGKDQNFLRSMFCHSHKSTKKHRILRSEKTSLFLFSIEFHDSTQILGGSSRTIKRTFGSEVPKGLAILLSALDTNYSTPKGYHEIYRTLYTLPHGEEEISTEETTKWEKKGLQSKIFKFQQTFFTFTFDSKFHKKICYVVLVFSSFIGFRTFGHHIISPNSRRLHYSKKISQSLRIERTKFV
jgi:hypothetical protein